MIMSSNTPVVRRAQGKIECYHRSMKNVVKLENYYYPWLLEKAIADWVQHYNHERYHESLDNVTPSDVISVQIGFYLRPNFVPGQLAVGFLFRILKIPVC